MEINNLENKEMLREYPDILSTEQVCEILGVCVKSVYGLLNKHKIKYFRIGNKYLISKACIIEFIYANLR